MKYQGNYRLVTNPRTKMSHSLRALLKKRERIEAAKHTPMHRDTTVGRTIGFANERVRGIAAERSEA